MDTYVVVHIKNKEEKVKVCSVLAAETEAKFHVTTDLKEYVGKQLNVKIMDNVEMKDQATDMGQERTTDIITVKDEAVNNIVDVVPVVDTPTIVSNIDTLHEQNTDIADIQPSNDVNTDSLLQIDNQQELFNIGTYVPYRDRMIEPKQERIDEVVGDDRWLMEMEREQEMMEGRGRGDIGLLVEMDGDGIDDTLTTIDKDIQSTSTKRRSGRIPEKEKGAAKGNIAVNDAPSSSRRLERTTKRPRYSLDDDNEEDAIRKEDATSTTRRSGRVTKQSKYSMDDSDNDSEHVLEAKKKGNTIPTPQETKKKDDCCQKCGSEKKGYLQKVEHVMGHAKLMKYECMVDGCEVKTTYMGNMRSHMKKKHKEQSNNYRQLRLTCEQTDEFNKMMEECFSVANDDYGNTCQICQQTIGQRNKREHALHHIDFMLYKCMEDGCQFESKTQRSNTLHICKQKKTGRPTSAKVELTKEQEEEIEEMFGKCFPGVRTRHTSR